MKYDGSDPLHRAQAIAKVHDWAARQTGIIEITTRKPLRSLSQNAYLHVCLGLFADEYGETIDYVKEMIFKAHVNRPLFVREKQDPILGNVVYLRSSAELTTEEMTRAIERFRDFASSSLGLYIPAASEHRLLEQAQIIISRNPRL